MTTDKENSRSDTASILAEDPEKSTEELLAETEELQKRLEEERQKLLDSSCKLGASPSPQSPFSPEVIIAAQRLEPLCQLNIKSRRVLKGHQGKVLCLDWSADRRHLASSAQDGRLLVWDAFTTNKEHAICTLGAWLVACAFAPSATAVAYGGLDGRVTVSSLVVDGGSRRTISAHSGFTSCCAFRSSDQQVLTAGGDGTCALWDVESGQLLQRFVGHAGSVFAMDVCPQEPGSTLVSSGRDRKLLVWDMRTGKRVQAFPGHQADVNTVRFHPSGDAVASGSDDAMCRLFDLRADQQVALFSKESILFGVNGLDFSLSGRILFAGYGDSCVNVWDCLRVARLLTLYGHENRISCLRTSPDGTAIATSSWDTTIRVWA